MKEKTYADKGSHKLRSDYWKALRKGKSDYLPDKIPPPITVEISVSDNFIAPKESDRIQKQG